MKIDSRTFIVSGGASGLGRATCLNLAQAGGYVAILDSNEDLALSVVSELGQKKGKFFEVDVSKTESISSAVADILKWVRITGMEIGGVVTAAGVGKAARIIDRHGDPFSIDDFDFIMTINVRGTIDLCRQILPHLTSINPIITDEGERGVIILVASAAAFEGQPGQVAYSASKGAIISLTLPLMRDLSRYGIRVVTIAPGLFETNMASQLDKKARESLERVMEFPTRTGRPEEFASAVKGVIENGMLNGAIIRLDGGIRMPRGSFHNSSFLERFTATAASDTRSITGPARETIR